MKVLLVSEYWKPRIMGGGEISAGLMAKGLAESGADVSVLTSRFPGTERFEEADGVKIYRRLTTGSRPGSALSNLRRAMHFSRSVERELSQLDREEDYDVIHSLNITSLVGVAGSKEKAGKPIVAHINSPTPFCPRGILLRGDRECKERCDLTRFSECMRKFGSVSKMKTPIYLSHNPLFAYMVYRNFEMKRAALGKFDHFMPISTFMKGLLMGEGIPEERITVVPNIVETDKFLSVKNVEHAVPKILYLGPYAEFKGPQILVSALSRLKAGYECDMFGRGYFEDALRSMIKEKGVNARIYPEAPYDDIPRIFQEHDILVFPSLVSEAFGRVAVEAMAAGKPVIASNIGGVTDIVDDGKTGFLIPPGDIVGLRSALEKLLAGPELRKEMGELGRKTAEERFAPDAIIKKVLSVYRKAAG